jgi:ABC-type glycerol-3-phosphate transport system permease component
MLLNFGIPANIVQSLMMVINGIFELVWKSGVQILLMLSGLQSIPSTVYEAAEIEGATAWEIFWKITVPMVSPIIILCAFYTVVDVSTDYSNQIILHIRNIASNLRLSEASTLSNIWFLIIITLIGLVFLIAGRKVYYRDDK